MFFYVFSRPNGRRFVRSTTDGGNLNIESAKVTISKLSKPDTVKNRFNEKLTIVKPRPPVLIFDSVTTTKTTTTTTFLKRKLFGANKWIVPWYKQYNSSFSKYWWQIKKPVLNTFVPVTTTTTTTQKTPTISKSNIWITSLAAFVIFSGALTYYLCNRTDYVLVI